MRSQHITRAIGVAIASAVALGAAMPSSAAPVLSMTAAVKEAAPSPVTEARYYRGGYYRNNGAAVALGILGVAGAVAGAAAYNGYGYRDPGYYPQRYYGGGPFYGYARSPAYQGYPSNYGYHNFY